MIESVRIQNNKNKLLELYPSFRMKIEGVLKDLEQAGYRPRIQTAWRSQAAQMEAFRNGASKVQFGFHNVTGANGEKESLAADILDDDRPNTADTPFALHLAAAAEARGLTTGIRWDLKDEDSVLIDIAILNKNWNAKVKIGWDPLHVEPVGITIAEAKAGKRPDFEESDSPVEAEPPRTYVQKKRRFRVLDLDTEESAEYENWSTAFKPVTLLPVPYVSQLGEDAETHKNDCGAACCVMLLRAYVNSAMTPDEFYTAFNIAGDPYLSVQTMRNAMGKTGVMTNYKVGLTMAELFNTFATGKPAIVLIRYKTLEDAGLTEKHFEGPHFAVGVGMDTKYVYLHDPLYTNPSDGEAHPYPLDLFWKAWTEVAQDPLFPNPARAAIIPAVGLGYPMERRLTIANIYTLNVRSGPGLGYPVVGKLKAKDIVTVTREINGWGEIGADQWILLKYTLPAA
jgi:hypothetical protein